MILLGCRPPGRHVEQHDFFFGIAENLKDLKPLIKKFWPDSGNVHIDAWRAVTKVEGFNVNVILNDLSEEKLVNRLFFINLGGYLSGKFEEQHYTILTVKQHKSEALKTAKATLFYQHNQFEGAVSHIDDKYGIDIDELYDIEELLLPSQKKSYRIQLTPCDIKTEDELHLGYLKLSSIK